MKILVVEDQRRLAESIAKGLCFEKFLVETAYDGKTAMEKITTEKWDIVILDWMLPIFSGKQILEKMRQLEISTPVLFLTARGEISDKVEILETGADDYLVKPFDFEELVARVNALLRRPKSQIKSVLRIGNLSFDTNSKLVMRGEKEITLSATEFRLLEYLMRSKEQVKSESEILSHVWDHADISLSNKVPVYIRYIRNKIDKDFPQFPNLIQTVRGLGYMISNQKK